MARGGTVSLWIIGFLRRCLARVTAAAGKVIPKGKVTRKKFPVEWEGERQRNGELRAEYKGPLSFRLDRYCLTSVSTVLRRAATRSSTAVRTVAKFAAAAATSCIGIVRCHV